MKLPNIISEGTLLPQDLIPAFLDAIKGIDEEVAKGYAEEIPDDADDAWYVSEEAVDFIDSLIEELNENAPPYLYFGTSPDDGASFGFWINDCLIEEDISHGELQLIGHPDELDTANTSCMVLLMGDKALYSHDGDKWQLEWESV